MAYKTRSNTMKLQRLIDYLKDRGSDLASNLETSAAIFFDDVKPKSKPPLHLLYDSDSGSSYCGEQDDDENWGSDWEEDFGDEEPPDLVTEPTPEIEIRKPSTTTDLKKEEPILATDPLPVPLVVQNPVFSQPVDILPLTTVAKVEAPIIVEKVELSEHLPVSACQVVQQPPEPQPQKEVSPPHKTKHAKDAGPKAYLSGFHSSKSVPTPLMKFTTHVNIPNSFGAARDQAPKTSAPSKKLEKSQSLKKHDEDVHIKSTETLSNIDLKSEPLDKKQSGKSNSNELKLKETNLRKDIKEVTSASSSQENFSKVKDEEKVVVSDIEISPKVKVPEIVKSEKKSSSEKPYFPIQSSPSMESKTLPTPPVIVTQLKQEVKNEGLEEKISPKLDVEDHSNTPDQTEDLKDTPSVPLVMQQNKPSSEVVKSPTKEIQSKSEDPTFNRLHVKAASSPNLKYYGRSNNPSLTTINESSAKVEAAKVDSSLESLLQSETIVEKSPDKLCVPYSVKRSRSGSILKSSSPSRDDDSFLNTSPPKHVHFLIEESQATPSSSSSSSSNPPTVQSVRRRSPNRKSVSPVLDQTQAQAYQTPHDVEVPVVGGQRSRKPTLASQWRKQQEKKKRLEQNLLSRLETFTTWSCENTSEAEAEHLAAQIAEAGFYYIGLNDSVKCNQCGLILKDWTTSDNPWARHAQKRIDCPFLIEVKGQEWVNRNLKQAKG